MKEIINKDIQEEVISSYLIEKELKLSKREKIEKIAYHFSEIMDALELDLDDDSLGGTPGRVARMFVNESFSGLIPENKPAVSLFKNKYGYKKMLVEKDITLYSTCEHHFVPIIGKVHVGYIPYKHVIGLSKINRMVQYYAKRPQVQERLTVQIAEALKRILKNENVAVMIEADHLCVASRGIKDTNSLTVTASYSGKFEKESIKNEFLSYIELKV